MPYCIFDRTTGEYKRGFMQKSHPYDPGTEVELVLPSYPDKRTQRWDGATGLRAATAQELATVDEAAREAESQQLFEQMKAAILTLHDNQLALLDEINTLRGLHSLGPKPGQTPAQLRQAIIDKAKSL